MGPFIEATCGSLGQGLSVAIGCALAAKRQGRASRVYVIIGDGEMQEGQVWEAAMFAGAKGLDNLCVIVDCNFVQVEGRWTSSCRWSPVTDKMESFGFACQEVDGNDIGALLGAYDQARETKSKASFIKANTLMGKGVASLEGMMFHQLRFPPEVAASAAQNWRHSCDVHPGRATGIRPIDATELKARHRQRRNRQRGARRGSTQELEGQHDSDSCADHGGGRRKSAPCLPVVWLPTDGCCIWSISMPGGWSHCSGRYPKEPRLPKAYWKIRQPARRRCWMRRPNLYACSPCGYLRAT